MSPPRPAWTDADTLLLPIGAEAWPLPRATPALDGIAFVPKRELHVTLVGRALGAELREAGRQADALAACAALDWRFRRRGEWWRLRDASGDRQRHSIIERIDLPALDTLYARLEAMLGRRLPRPPPHVTLYVAGDGHGIGVPDESRFARLAVRRVDADELDLR